MLGQPTGSDNPSGAERLARPRQASDSCVLKLKGLPYTTTEQEIYEFFQGFQLTKVAFVLESDGRPSGLAFAEFDSAESALRAMRKNGEYIKDRYVKLLHVPKQEMEDQVKFGTAAIPRPQRRQLPPSFVPGAQFPPMSQFQQGFMRGGIPVSQIVPNPVSTNPLHLPSYWGSAEQQLLWGSGSQTGGLPGAPSPASLTQSHLSPSPQASARPYPHIKHFNADGSTIRIWGLPFRATKEELMEFLAGLEFIPDSIQIGHDNTGRATGEGWVTFVSPEEARKAVRLKNRQYLHDRYLELSVMQVTL